MREQPVDLRRSLQIVRRRLVAVCAIAGLGLVAGSVYAALTPPAAASSALVLLPPSARDATTQAVIAVSENVLASAERAAHTAMPLPDFRRRIDVTVPASGVLSVQATASTATEAESFANAVASSYIAYVTALPLPDQTAAQMLAPATTASTGSRFVWLLIWGGLGALAGGLVGVIAVLGVDGRDRRLRRRGDIANAIGVPVLASLPTWRAKGAHGWAKLLDSYEPGSADAWQLARVLRHLEASGPAVAPGGDGGGYSVMVLSVTSDRRALALGPQLAVSAARAGIKTALIVCPQQNVAVMATLRVACAAYRPTAGTRGLLDVSVADPGLPCIRPDAPLTVVVTAVDAAAPQMAGTIRTTATVLAVSAGAATDEQLARVAAAAGADGRQIDGFLVADPDPGDRTSGRIPALARLRDPRGPTRSTEVPAGPMQATISQPVRTSQ